MDKTSVDDVIKLVQSLEASQQAKISQNCHLEPTNEQLVRLMSQYSDSRLSKLMRDIAFVPRNEDCLQIMSNLEPGMECMFID